MLKLKMSLLLKNSKFRVTVIALLIASILAGIVYIPMNKAASISNQVDIKANKSNISANGHSYYVIRKMGNAKGYDNIFCIEQDATLSSKTYSNPIEITKASKYFNSYNSIMWLTNNMYVTSTTGEDGIDNTKAKKVLAMNLANMLTSSEVMGSVSNAGVDTSSITAEKIYNLRNKTLSEDSGENALQFAEQLAMWKYTKNVGSTFTNAYRESSKLSGTSLSQDEQNTLKYVYYALMALADKNADASSSTVASNYITLNKENAKFDSSTHQIGPYYLEANGEKLKSYSFGSIDNASYPVAVTILKNDGTTYNGGAELINKKDDGSFYIDLTKFQNAVRVDMQISGTLSGYKTEAYVLDGGNKQNLMTVSKSISSNPLKDTKEISIPGEYNVILKKVEKDGSTVITSSEAEFSINGNKQSTSGGVLTIASNKKIENASQVDTYTISEETAPNGYKKLNGTAKLTVGFKEENGQYVIDSNKVVTEGFDAMKLALSEDNKTITVSVLNDKEEEKGGKFNVVLKKVKEDGTTVITTSEASFTVNNNKVSTKQGTLVLENETNIESVDQVKTYTIKEDVAPEGYKAISGEAVVSVKFKEDGNKYVIDADNSKFEGKDEMSNAKMEISKDNATITIYVPNKQEEQKSGTFSVSLRKVKEDGSTLISSSDATFDVNGTAQKTSNGVLNIESNRTINNADETVVYTIEEKEAPEGYEKISGKATITVKFKQDGNKYIIDKDNTKIEGTEGMANAKIDVPDNSANVVIYVPNKEIKKEEKKFDMSLRKFISKVNDKDVENSRAPIINSKSIEMLESTGTASYYHTKDSVKVNVGDTVEYTIRIYNEGDTLGFAKQIKDYLPEGLSLVGLSSDSSKEYVLGSRTDEKVAVIQYTGSTEIKSLRDFVGKSEVNLTSEYYQEVKLVCKVLKTDVKYITNRSEITEYGYYDRAEGRADIFRQAKAIGDVDIDSVQGTISNSLRLNEWYENAKERTYTDETGKTVVDTNYYPGEQDDDDFETVEINNGGYKIIIKKVDADNSQKTLSGAEFVIKGTTIQKEIHVGPTGENGELTVMKDVKITSDKQVDEYRITETVAPKDYKVYNGEIVIKVGTKIDEKGVLVIDRDKVTANEKNIECEVSDDNTTITVIIPDDKKEFDLSLRQFITEVNGEKIKESREAKVDITNLVNETSTTAKYTHTKEAVTVNTSNIVTYTIRVYNEGSLSGYATRIMDDIPNGLEFVPSTFDGNKATNINAEYRWVMYREVKEGESVSSEKTITYNNKTYVVTENVKEATIVVTDYLSKEVNANNILKAFDAHSMTELDYKDIKLQFKVVEPKTSERIITNHAQISANIDFEGKTVIDRDSTVNVWEDSPRDDDQDIENIKVRYFDLSLKKWVTKAIVYENGYETVTETGHTPDMNPEPVVKVDLKNTNINNVEVKFEYTIRVTNDGAEGQIAGYAKEISDYIPDGLKFVAGDNPDWVEKDGKIVTRALENKLLQPGESADVKVILTWENGEDNFGLKTNVAEISEDYNEFGTPDIDSTPNNKVEGEDDIDNAPVILAIRTGGAIVYTGVAIVSLAIIAGGAYIVKRRILNRNK